MTYRRDGYQNPIPTTDLIIECSSGNKEGIVLITRKKFPYGKALPGGFHELGLSAEKNAIKEGKEETNLEIVLQDPERPLCYHTDPHRDPRYHIISATFIATGRGTLRAGDDAKTADLYSLDEIVELLKTETFAFPDHKRAIEKYLTHRGYTP